MKDTTLVFGGGLTTNYQDGVIRTDKAFGDEIVYTIKEPELKPFAENAIDQLNEAWNTKMLTTHLLVDNLCSLIKSMFWYIDGEDKKIQNNKILEYNDTQIQYANYKPSELYK